jgi:hypothetical protein
VLSGGTYFKHTLKVKHRQNPKGYEFTIMICSIPRKMSYGHQAVDTTKSRKNQTCEDLQRLTFLYK